ncbi:hypothetical protein DRQ16_00025, partial [bacterium]
EIVCTTQHLRNTIAIYITQGRGGEHSRGDGICPQKMVFAHVARKWREACMVQVVVKNSPEGIGWALSHYQKIKNKEMKHKNLLVG